MTRILKASAALMISVLLVVGATGCKPKMVRVETGEIVNCTYGHVVSDTTKTTSVPQKDVAKYGVKTSTIVCDRHKLLGETYDKAQKALADGDLATAEKLLAEVASADAGFRQATSQLAKVRNGEKPAPDGSTGGNTTTKPKDEKPGDENPTGPSMNFAKYTPDTLPGWTAQTPVADPFVLTRHYLPTSSIGTQELVIVVEQFQDAKAAAAYMKNTLKPSYPDASASLTLNGKPGYYGQAGSDAVVAFTDGALVISLGVNASSGKVSALKTKLVDAAKVVSR